MYGSYIVKRTQIYLEPDQSRELSRQAGVRGVTASHLIREAIARYLADPEDDGAVLAAQRSAVLDAAGSVPRLPAGTETVEQLREADLVRDRELETRWRSG